MTQVLAQAIVDPAREPLRAGPWLDDLPRNAGGEKIWSVTVTGYHRGADPKTARRRIYIIDAKTDTLAAEEGIRRFCAELEGDGDGAI